MKFATIKKFDIANGPGARTCLFVSGCTHACPGCFNYEAWDFEFGNEFTKEVEDDIIESLKPTYVRGLTLLGGEPMEPSNQRALAPFLRRVRKAFPHKSIWVFTGDLLENLQNEQSRRHTEETQSILECIDVLVDGPFVKDLYDITLRFRGSSNQRIIDMPKTLEAGHVVLWEDEEMYASHKLA